MAYLLEFHIAKSFSRDVVDGLPSPWRADSFAHLVLAPRDAARLTHALSSFGNDADQFLELDSRTRSRGEVPDPCAIILLPRDYLLAGHFIQIRGERSDVKFSYASYSSQSSPSAYPPLSLIYLPDWDIGARLALQSPLVGGAWELLSTADRERHWLCVADPLPDEWVTEHEAIDREIFRLSTGR